MSSTSNKITLDNQSILRLLAELSQEEQIIFSELMQECREIGANASSVVVEELGKKYADRSCRLVSNRSQA